MSVVIILAGPSSIVFIWCGFNVSLELKHIPIVCLCVCECVCVCVCVCVCFYLFLFMYLFILFIYLFILHCQLACYGWKMCLYLLYRALPS